MMPFKDQLTEAAKAKSLGKNALIREILDLKDENKQLQNELRYLIEICEANLSNLDSDLRFQYAKKLVKS